MTDWGSKFVGSNRMTVYVLYCIQYEEESTVP